MSEKIFLEAKPQQGECVVGKFLRKDIRKVFHNDEWWFSVIDVVNSLNDNEKDVKDEGAYWRKLKERLIKEGGNEVVTNCHELKLPAKDGKYRETDCANIEGIFRIMQSVPSKKAEPFKKWLAKVGFERIEEIKDPMKAYQRAVMYYKLKGYDDKWLQSRLKGKETREALESEWKNRGIEKHQDYATLTNIIHQETFGVSVSKHKDIKSLKKENLRDNMQRIELIFQELGEASTIEEAKNKIQKA